MSLTLLDTTAVKAGETAEDARLLAAATRQDRQAFSLLLARHYQVVYRVVWRSMRGHVDAEDVTQEAFLKLWKNPGQVREAGALRAWLIRVATNIAHDRHKADSVMQSDEGFDSIDESEDQGRALEQQQVTKRIDRAIADLPERQRLALTLVQFEQMSNQAAAEIMEISVDALESLLARARRTLKQELAGEWQSMLSAFAH